MEYGWNCSICFVIWHFYVLATKKLRKREKIEPSRFELQNTQKNHRSACDNPTHCARWQFVANYIISLPFIAQHVIDKKLVLSLTRLSFPLVRFRLYHVLPVIAQTTRLTPPCKGCPRCKGHRSVVSFPVRIWSREGALSLRLTSSSGKPRQALALLGRTWWSTRGGKWYTI